MYDLLEMDFFNLLADASQEVTNKEIQNAYGEFIEQIRIVSNESDYAATFRYLVAIRIEIASLETTPLYGQGKKCA